MTQSDEQNLLDQLARCGLGKWLREPTQEEALRSYLRLVPVVHRDFLPWMLPQKPAPRLVRWAQARGIVRSDRPFLSYTRAQLLWSSWYIRGIAGHRCAWARERDYYHQYGWNPVVAPLALLNVAASIYRPAMLLLGEDLLSWARTFCPPDTVLPTDWSLKNGGTGVGVLLVPSANPEIPEEWVFYLEPACKLKPAIKSLVEAIAPVLSARLHFGVRVTCTLLVGFDEGPTPGTTHAKIRLNKAYNLFGTQIAKQVPIAAVVGAEAGLRAVMSLASPPGFWRFFTCKKFEPLTWMECKLPGK